MQEEYVCADEVRTRLSEAKVGITIARGAWGADGTSLADDFHQHALATQAVEFAVENLLPRAEVEAAVGHGNHNLPAHNAAFEVGVGVVLRTIVTVLVVRFFRRELLKPLFEIGMETTFVVIDEDAGRDVHGVDQTQSFFDAAGAEAFFNLWRDVDQAAARGDFEPEFFAKGFHDQGAWPKRTRRNFFASPEGRRLTDVPAFVLVATTGRPKGAQLDRLVDDSKVYRA